MMKKLLASVLLLVSVNRLMAYDQCVPMSEASCDALNGYYDLDYSSCCFADQAKFKAASQSFKVIFVNDDLNIPAQCEYSLNPRFCATQGGYPVGDLCCYDM